MNSKKILACALLLCLLCATLSPAAHASEPTALGDFFDRYGPLLGDGLDALTDWLDGQAAKLAPELRETLHDFDADDLLSDLAALVSETRGMDDAALRAAVESLAEKHGIHLAKGQAEQLMALCRTLEKLDARELKERVDALKRELDGDGYNAPGGLRGAWNAVVRAVTDAADWLVRTVGGWFR